MTPPRSADAVDREVGRRIAIRRLALGLSQTALAERAGVSFQQVQKYESGMNRVSASRLHRIALALGAPAGAFFPDSPVQAAPQAIDPPGPARRADERILIACLPRIANVRVRRALTRLVIALADPA